MKLSVLLFSGLSADLSCEHPKLTEMTTKLKEVKHSTDYYNEGSRFWASENNKLREVSRNLTMQIEEIEFNVKRCTDLLVISEENNRHCPSDVSKSGCYLQTFFS